MQWRGTVVIREVIEPYGLELTQSLHLAIDLSGIHPLRVQDRLRVIKDYGDLLGG